MFIVHQNRRIKFSSKYFVSFGPHLACAFSELVDGGLEPVGFEKRSAIRAEAALAASASGRMPARCRFVQQEPATARIELVTSVLQPVPPQDLAPRPEELHLVNDPPGDWENMTEATKIGEEACVALSPEFLQTLREHVSLVG
jgi:hypothetical protein